MKLNTITSAIAIAISALIAYGFYSFGSNEQNLLLTGGSFILLGTTLVLSIGVRYTIYNMGINAHGISTFFFLAGFISNLVFSFISFTASAYIIVHGIMFLLYLLLLYYVIRSQKV